MLTSLPVYSQTDTNVVPLTLKKDTLPAKQIPPVKEAPGVKVSMFKGHSPKLATLMSAIVPGLGQIYNHKYWKVPIIYGSIGICLHFVREYDTYYRDFKRSYTYDHKEVKSEFDPYPQFKREQLVVYINDARRYRDLNGFLIVFVYALNVIDACVDAHLYKFDISDDLSLKFQPHIDYLPGVNHTPINGLGLMLTFK